MPKTLRVFWAVCPQQQALDEVAALVRELKKPLSALGLSPSWCRPDGLHVTLRFIGELAEEQVGEQVAHIERSLAAAQGELAAVGAQLGGLGLFAGPERPSVLFAQVHGARADAAPQAKTDPQAPAEPVALTALQGRLEGWLQELGLERDPRAFHPHLTLARFKHAGPDHDGRRAHALRELVQAYAPRRYGPRFPIDELVLFESLMGGDGPRYVPLARLPLAAGR